MLIKILIAVSIVMIITVYMISRGIRMWEELGKDLEEFCNTHEPAIMDKFMQRFQSEFPDASNSDHNTAIDFCKFTTNNMLMGMLDSIGAIRLVMTNEGPAIKHSFFMKKSLDYLIFEGFDGTLEDMGYKEAFAELSAATLFAYYKEVKRDSRLQEFLESVTYCDITETGLLIPEEKTNNGGANDV